jgi:hypothetical protein
MIEAPITLLIGDDILVSPTLVAKHLALHAAHPEASVAALGFTRWSEK